MTDTQAVEQFRATIKNKLRDGMEEHAAKSGTYECGFVHGLQAAYKLLANTPEPDKGSGHAER